LDNNYITIRMQLSEDEAREFAQFLKRAYLDIYRGLATNLDEAYLMQDAGEKIRSALAEVGFNPS